MGRQTKYKQDFPERALEMAENGLFEYEITKNLGISHQTSNEYKKAYPEYLEAIKGGKDVADSFV